MEMQFLNCSQYKATRHRSRQSFRSLLIQSNIQSSLVPWNESRSSSKTYLAASRVWVTWGSSEDAKVVSDLMDDIQAAIVHCQVSGQVQIGSDT
jgi:hypothetical protein